jgi:hypothetical protein
MDAFAIACFSFKVAANVSSFRSLCCTLFIIVSRPIFDIRDVSGVGYTEACRAHITSRSVCSSMFVNESTLSDNCYECLSSEQVWCVSTGCWGQHLDLELAVCCLQTCQSVNRDDWASFFWNPAFITGDRHWTVVSYEVLPKSSGNLTIKRLITLTPSFVYVMMMMMMSRGWDYVYELRPPTAYCSLQVIYERGESWWNDMDRVKILTFPSALWKFYQREYLGSKQEEWTKGMRI